MANTEKQIRNYIQRQKNWIKANDLKPGDKVLVRKAHASYSKGWNNPWTVNSEYNMNLLIGKTIQVKHRVSDSGIEIDVSPVFDPDSSSWFVPYTILQKVE